MPEPSERDRRKAAQLPPAVAATRLVDCLAQGLDVRFKCQYCGMERTWARRDFLGRRLRTRLPTARSVVRREAVDEATHLLENKTDIRVIQALLGHKKTDTTARYTRVATKILRSVESPLSLLKPATDQPPPLPAKPWMFSCSMVRTFIGLDAESSAPVDAMRLLSSLPENLEGASAKAGARLKAMATSGTLMADTERRPENLF